MKLHEIAIKVSKSASLVVSLWVCLGFVFQFWFIFSKNVFVWDGASDFYFSPYMLNLVFWGLCWLAIPLTSFLIILSWFISLKRLSITIFLKLLTLVMVSVHLNLIYLWFYFRNIPQLFPCLSDLRIPSVVQLAELWPNGFMDNHGIKRAVCRAKDRRRALYNKHKVCVIHFVLDVGKAFCASQLLIPIYTIWCINWRYFLCRLII